MCFGEEIFASEPVFFDGMGEGGDASGAWRSEATESSKQDIRRGSKK